MVPGHVPSVAILLCTYQGSRFIQDQILSIKRQTHQNISLWVSDDGSEDDTVKILEEIKADWDRGAFSIRPGPRKGFAQNFLSLTSLSDIQADYYAYADQDDVWEPDKLTRAIALLSSVPTVQPTLYVSRTQLIDENNHKIGFSRLFLKPPSFANALVQSIAGANTMVMNHAARKLLKKTSENLEIYSHDQWAYMVISGAGGMVFYDDYPGVRYRQHKKNLKGKNIGWRAGFDRIALLFKGEFKKANEMNIAALKSNHSLLTERSLGILDSFCKARTGSFFQRAGYFFKSGVYRQTLIGNFGLMIAVVFKRI